MYIYIYIYIHTCICIYMYTHLMAACLSLDAGAADEGAPLDVALIK